MTSRENFIAFFSGKPYEWAPTNFDSKAILPEELPENSARGIVSQKTPYRKKGKGTGWFGVEWEFIPMVGGSIETNRVLSDIADWRSLPWPDLDAIDWEGIKRNNAEVLKEDKLFFMNVFSTYFERLISLLGFENAAIALYDEDKKPHVHELFEALTELYTDYIGRLRKYMGIDMIMPHDDWGTQRAPIFSPSVHNEMIVPYVKRLVDAAHDAGMFYEQHSCGLIDPLIPGMISTGADCWTGQEVTDKYDLVCRYGKNFKFGVIIRKPEDCSDLEGYIKAFTEKYRGYRVYYSIRRDFTPEQRDLIADVIRHAEI